MPHRRTDLLDELSGELDPTEAEALFARLEAHAVPEPTTAETDALIDRLRPLTPRPRPRRFREVGLTREPLALFLATQAHHFRPAWWLASLAFVLMGLAAQGVLAARGLSVAVIAPALVIGGVAYAFRSLRGAALELELACPVTPAQVTLSRILVPLGYYLLLGALPALSAGEGGRLLLSWTAALFLFTGLFLTLTLYMGPLAASVVALVAWGALIGLHLHGLSPFSLAPNPLWTPMQVGALVAGLLLLLHALAPGRIYRLLERGSR
jgi:hypothetical protein